MAAPRTDTDPRSRLQRWVPHPWLTLMLVLLWMLLLNDFSLHRFKADDLMAAQQRGLRPGALRVVDGGLQLELLPLSN